MYSIIEFLVPKIKVAAKSTSGTPVLYSPLFFFYIKVKPKLPITKKIYKSTIPNPLCRKGTFMLKNLENFFLNQVNLK